MLHLHGGSTQFLPALFRLELLHNAHLLKESACGVGGLALAQPIEGLFVDLNLDRLADGIVVFIPIAAIPRVAEPVTTNR